MEISNNLNMVLESLTLTKKEISRSNQVIEYKFNELIGNLDAIDSVNEEDFYKLYRIYNKTQKIISIVGFYTKEMWNVFRDNYKLNSDYLFSGEDSEKLDKFRKIERDLINVKNKIIDLASNTMEGKRYIILKNKNNENIKIREFTKIVLSKHFYIIWKRSGINSALFQVKNRENITAAYLFPSVHVASKKSKKLPQCIDELIQHADCAAFEVDITEGKQSQIQELKAKKTITKALETLSEYQIEKIKKNKNTLKIRAEKHPTQLHFAFLTIENAIKKRVENKKIIDLETIETQLDVSEHMEKISPPLEIEITDYTSLEENNICQLDAWQRGDIETSFKIETQHYSPDDTQKVLYDRNKAMAQRLDILIKEGKIPFACIGLSHFGGQDSLQKLLEEKGYSLHRIN